VSDNEQVLEEIVSSFGDETWCDENPYGFSGVERYAVSWSAFCRTVKHQTRYFFSESAELEERFGSDNELIPVPTMLANIAEILQSAGVNIRLSANSPLFRVRPHKPEVDCASAVELGPPPEDIASNSRMSAAGVSVFYGAFELETAIAEIVPGLPRRHGKVLTCAEWRTTRELHLADLTRLPPLGSRYAERREDRAPYVFLKHFVEELTRPVVHDGKEHIEYVPTQILTEYLRLYYKPGPGHALDGIIYPSAQRKGGRSVVLFTSHGAVDPNARFSARNAVLKLVDNSIHRMKVPRRAHRRKRSFGL
jgi:RES domain-containing protein